MKLCLNAFHVALSSGEFSVHCMDLPNPDRMTALRESHGHEWFLTWREGTAYAIPLTDQTPEPFGRTRVLQCTDNIALGIVAARINSLLPNIFPQYDALRRRPFAFLGQRDELVSDIIAQLKLRDPSPLLNGFTIRPKFELDARLIEPRDGSLGLALVMDIRMKWDITTPIHDLHEAGVNLSGLHVIRPDPEPGERRLVGCIDHVDGRTITLSDSFDGTATVATDTVVLEGSTSSFYRCLRHLLGSSFDAFDNARFAKASQFLTGPALDTLHQTMAGVLRRAPQLQVTPEVTCTFGERVELANTSEYRTVVQLGNPEYCFDPAKSKRAKYAWGGLERFGPYSRDTFSKTSPRILVLCPDKAQGQVEQFIRAFRDGITSVPNSKFATGFSRVFGLNNPHFAITTVPLLNNRDTSIAAMYRSAAEEALASPSASYDAAFIVIPDQYASAPDALSPYLHAKAVCLMAGVPVQEARLSTITRPHNQLMYVAQNIAIALYAKLGGVPWTVDHDLTVTDELVIGMGTCEMSGSRFESRQRHIGITTVFRGDGNYLLSNVSRECTYADYPRVLKESTLAILREIRSRNGWQQGDTVRLVFHSFKPLRGIEVADIARECVAELGNEQQFQFAFLTVSHAHPFKLLDKRQPGRSGWRGQKKGVFVPERGYAAQLGRFTRLLCANGPTLIKQATSPLPAPLLIHLHPESTYGDLDYLAEQVLKFTSLSWRSTLPCFDPVTIYYSELIAGLLARLRAVPDWSPSMLNVKLRSSRWFL